MEDKKTPKCKECNEKRVVVIGGKEVYICGTTTILGYKTIKTSPRWCKLRKI